MAGKLYTPPLIKPHELNDLIVHGHKYHPDHSKKVIGDRAIENLVKHWDGQKVWAVVDGIWRQATVLSTVPNPEPGGEWTFTLGSKHDAWRHLLTTKPLDDTDLEFEYIQVTDYVDTTFHHEVPEFDHFHPIPPTTEGFVLRDHNCPVHPYVAELVKRLKEQVGNFRGTLDDLKGQLDQKTRECEELANREAELLDELERERDHKHHVVKREKDEKIFAVTKEQEEKIGLKEILKLRDEEICRLRAELDELKPRYDRKVKESDLIINNLQDELNHVTELNEELASDNKIFHDENEHLKGHLRTIEAEKEKIINELRVESMHLCADNEHLDARNKALEEALQAATDTATKAAHAQAEKNARESTALEAEVDRLREILNLYKEGQGEDLATHTTGIDREELNKWVAEKESLEEAIKELRYLLNEFRAADINNGVKILSDLFKRVSELEKVMRPDLFLEESKDEELDPYTRKGLDKQERKAIRDRIRLATRLREEIKALRTRVEEIEKARALPSPPADEEVKSPALVVEGGCWGGLSPVVMINRTEINALRLHEAKLLADNARLVAELKSHSDPTASEAQVLRLEAAVQGLSDRIDVAENTPVQMQERPMYVPTFTRYMRFKRNPNDGNYPWLATARVFDLEKENKDLRRRLEFAKKEHKDNSDSIDVLVRPVLEENHKLRSLMQEYGERVTELTAAMDNMKKDKASAFW